MEKDACVICGTETVYDPETPVEQRLNYVEGTGQLCQNCAERLENGGQYPAPVLAICPHCHFANIGEGEVGVVICKRCQKMFNR